MSLSPEAVAFFAIMLSLKSFARAKEIERAGLGEYTPENPYLQELIRARLVKVQGKSIVPVSNAREIIQKLPYPEKYKNDIPNGGRFLWQPVGPSDPNRPWRSVDASGDLLAHRVAFRFLATTVDRSLSRAVSASMTHIASRKPLYGYDSMENSYLVDDYPYGARLRCKIRYWLEFSGSKGFRFCSQTQDPRNGRWNNPKKSTYALLAACMYLDEKDHVQWDSLSEYSDGAKVLEFVKAFPNADFRILKVFAAKKIKYLEASAAGKVVWTINGVPQPVSEEDMGRAKKDLDTWEDAFKIIR